MYVLILLNLIADITWKSHIFSPQLCDLFIYFAVYCEFCVLIGDVINSNFLMLFIPCMFLQLIYCPIYAHWYKQFMTIVNSYMLQHQGTILWEPL